MRNTRNEPQQSDAAEVLPKTRSVYNGRVMRIAKKAYSPLVLVLSLGLMYSQVCNVICAFSNCSAPAAVRKSKTVEHGAHCHQKRKSSQQTSQKDQPPKDQHKCPAHVLTASIPPSETSSTVLSNDARQTALAEFVSSFEIVFDLAGKSPDHGGRFRSPPRWPQFTILRI
jgi:hypothetical protein